MRQVQFPDNWMTRPTRHCILYQSKTGSIVTSWSGHHCTISHHHCTTQWWVMRSNHYWIGPSLSLGICQVSIMLFSSHGPSLLCSIILPLTLCHMPLFLFTFELIPFPWWHFPFVSADSFVLMTHFISLMILPIVPSCLCFLLSPYLWFACLQSSVTATLFIFKLY